MAKFENDDVMKKIEKNEKDLFSHGNQGKKATTILF